MSGFAAYLPEVFEAFGPVSLLRMFGGHGVYHDGLMFGLVAGDVLYLKCDATSAPRFDALALEPFVYETKDGRRTAMSYRRAPDDILDDRDAAAQWARLAVEAARRAQAGTRRPRAKAARTAPAAKPTPARRKTNRSAPRKSP